jgi:hypothetical protein
MSKRKANGVVPKIKQTFYELMDVNEINHAIEAIKDNYIDEPKITARTIRRLLIVPIEEWLEIEDDRLKAEKMNSLDKLRFEKTGEKPPRTNTDIEAIMPFYIKIEDLADRLENDRLVSHETVDSLKGEWKKTLLVFGSNKTRLVARQEKINQGLAKKNRKIPEFVELAAHLRSLDLLFPAAWMTIPDCDNGGNIYREGEMLRLFRPNKEFEPMGKKSFRTGYFVVKKTK